MGHGFQTSTWSKHLSWVKFEDHWEISSLTFPSLHFGIKLKLPSLETSQYLPTLWVLIPSVIRLPESFVLAQAAEFRLLDVCCRGRAWRDRSWSSFILYSKLIEAFCGNNPGKNILACLKVSVNNLEKFLNPSFLPLFEDMYAFCS